MREWRAKLEASGFRPSIASSFRLRLEFSSWVRRIDTAEAHVQAICSLQALAGAQVNEHFALEADGSFTLDAMLMTAEG